jgi:hypothetical protein
LEPREDIADVIVVRTNGDVERWVHKFGFQPEMVRE